jgi:inorganic pyrophosphatase
VSPFHDIPLVANADKGTYNMVVEIPKGNNAKLEVNKGEAFNPIKQDIKKGNLRFVHDVEPHQGYMWNYGAFPQTWEDPTHKDEGTDAFGDDDPLDVCEIGSARGFVGEVKEVKVLGVMALIDEGETDWKVLVIDVNDPLAEKLSDIGDVHAHLPGFTMATYEWFRTYKMPAGSPANEFAFDGEAKDAAFAKRVIEENYQFWRRLHNGEMAPKTDKYDVAVANSQLGGTELGKFSVDADAAKQSVTIGTAQGVPSANTEPPAAPDASVLRQVQAAQRRQPHATASFGRVVADVAAALESAGGSLDAAVDAVKSAGNVRAVVTASGTVDVDGAQHYTVSLGQSGDLVFVGVYQSPTPHSVRQGLCDEVAAAGFDQVAAGVASPTAFAINGGAGKLVFALANGSFAHSADADAPALPAIGSDAPLLTVRAPAALFAAL